MSESILYIVGTPIGCLADLSPRAQEVLSTVELIISEDTRTTRKLLQAFGIKAPEIVSYFDGAELKKAAQLAARLQERGISAALVSEAGTPAISDPGYQLVKECHGMGIKVSPIPGASAPNALVSASGLPSDKVLFVGFLPTKASDLEKEIRSWYGLNASVVFFESARRISKTMSKICEQYPHCEVAFGRELTKMYEEIKVMPVSAADMWLQTATLKGEFTVMLSAQGLAADSEQMSGDDLDEIIRSELTAGQTVRDLLKRHRDAGLNRTALYQKILGIKNDL